MRVIKIKFINPSSGEIKTKRRSKEEKTSGKHKKIKLIGDLNKTKLLDFYTTSCVTGDRCTSICLN